VRGTHVWRAFSHPESLRGCALAEVALLRDADWREREIAEETMSMELPEDRIIHEVPDFLRYQADEGDVPWLRAQVGRLKQELEDLRRGIDRAEERP
jgi:hypothetical protein